MIATWMVYGIVVALVLVGGAALLDRVASARGASTRWIWLAAMLGTIVLVASAVRVVTEPLASPRAEEAQVEIMSSVSARPADPTLALSDRSVYTIISMLAAGAFDLQLLTLWACLSLVVVTALGGAVARLHLKRRRWVVTTVQGTEVMLTDQTGPAVVGVLPGRIVIPRWLLSLSPARQRLVLEHERQHLLARDPLVMRVGLIAAAAMPWNPVLWVMLRRLRTATEIDCDRRVMRVVPAAREYARLLIDVGARARGEPVLISALAEPQSDLERRVALILNPGTGRREPMNVLRFVAAATLFAAACASPKPAVLVNATPDALPSPEAPHAPQGAPVAPAVQAPLPPPAPPAPPASPPRPPLPVPPAPPVPPTPPLALDYSQVIAQAAAAVDEMVGLTRQLREAAAVIERNEEMMKQVITNRSLYDQLNETLVNSNRLISRLQAPNASAGRLMDDPALYAHMNEMIASMDSLIARINSSPPSPRRVEADTMFYRRAVEVTTKLDSLIRLLAPEVGSGARMLRNQQQYDDLVAAIKQIDELISDIRLNPQKYFRIRF